MWEVRFHPVATEELARLPPRERAAMINAVEKLTAFGPTLPFPHSSAIQGTEHMRELRPRAGRSPWRAFYRRLGDVLVSLPSDRRQRSISEGSTGPPRRPSPGWRTSRRSDREGFRSAEPPRCAGRRAQRPCVPPG